MKKSIVIIALEKELEHQKKLLQTVEEMLEYDPFKLMMTAIKDFNECTEINKKVDIANQIKRYSKDWQNRISSNYSLSNLIEKRENYRENIEKLKTSLTWESGGFYETI